MSPAVQDFKNPFRPGAGHPPPHLAGREPQTDEFVRLLSQETILENLVLTGLRGVGKTVLLDTFKPIAIREKWLWVGGDLTEAASISEENIAIRLLTDLSVITSSWVVQKEENIKLGFGGESTEESITLEYNTLLNIYQETPGLVADKIKKVLEIAWDHLDKDKYRGIVFAYDEAQNISDNAPDQFPRSLLLDVFQSIQRKGIPYLLALVGLPTLFPNLVESRTFAERMFRVEFLDRLSGEASRDAILFPIKDKNCPVKLSDDYVDGIIEISGGYPYFIQFICKEVYDSVIQKLPIEEGKGILIPIDGIILKLDSDFFAGRWARATDRQRDLLSIIAKLENSDSEFSVQEIVDLSKNISEKPFTNSHINQMLNNLTVSGLVYKNRRGKYSFAVPLFDRFIQRQVI